MKITNQTLNTIFLATLLAFSPAVGVTAKDEHAGPRGVAAKVLRGAAPPARTLVRDERRLKKSKSGYSDTSSSPSENPSATPSSSPTVRSSSAPSASTSPTIAPSSQPTVVSSTEPSGAPTLAPSEVPSATPTVTVSLQPSASIAPSSSSPPTEDIEVISRNEDEFDPMIVASTRGVSASSTVTMTMPYLVAFGLSTLLAMTAI